MAINKDNLFEKSKSDYQKLVEFIEKVIGFLALFSGILYFLGWTKANAYYLHFGLSLDLLGKSPVAIVSSAWFEIVIGIILFLLGYYLQVFVNHFGEKINPSNLKNSFNLFYIFLITSIIGGVYFFFQTTIFRSFVFVERAKDVGFMLLFVLVFWIAATIGKKLSLAIGEDSASKGISFFKIIYPNYYLFLVISILGMAYVLGILSAARGLYYGLRDIHDPADNLPAIILVTKSRFPMNGDLDTESGLYVYANLFYIDSNDEYIFVYGDAPGFDTSKLFRTYAIPKSDDVQMLFRK
jgi:hypothetical protein